jgi:hypothetical protein
VTLTWPMQARARAAGEARYARRRAAGSKQRYGRRAADHSVALEVEAIAAEIAVGHLIGHVWVDTDRPDRDTGDVGAGVQVRQTRHLGGRLLLHGDDADDHAFFLVVGIFPSFVVAGWITGAAGKCVGVVRELQPGRPCICVEQAQLWPVEAWPQPDRDIDW